MQWRTRIAAASWVFALFVVLPTGYAQPKPSYAPSSTHIFPAGARRGMTIKVLVGAECIPPETRFSVLGGAASVRNPAGPSKRSPTPNGGSFAATTLLTKRVESPHEPSPRRKPTIVPITIPREWESEVRVGKDAEAGTVYWRLSCAQGGTELRPFIIGDLPEFIETESNSTPQAAEELTLPMTINGRIYGERDTDYFRFSAKKGAVVVCDVLANRIRSRLDPIVEILDANGNSVRTETLYVKSDPVLAFQSNGGDYLLRIAHVSHHGDAAHVYRITLTTQPYVRSVFPAGGQAGTQREIEFRLMTGTSKPRVVKRTVRFPKSATAPMSYRLRLDGRPAATVVPLAVTGDVAFLETPANDAADMPQLLSLPVVVDGRFETAKDQDWFSFTAEKGTHYTIDCVRPTAGSRALPTLLLTDAKGNRLQFLRSVENESRRCRIDWQAPRGGLYRLRIRDQQFGVRGGPEFNYRLTVKRAEPDFELSVPAVTLNLQQGSEIEIPVEVLRYGGFDEPITLRVEGLPKGVKTKAELIDAKRTHYDLTLRADELAPAGDAVIRIVGVARAGLKKLEHAAQPKDAPQHLDAGQIHLTVQHRPMFRLYCSEAYQYAYRGSIFRYPMTIERLNGFDGEVTIQEGDRQNRDMDGIEIGTIVVPPNVSEAIVPIYLPETMHINVQSQSQLYSQAYAFFKDTHGRRQSMLVLAEKRNMLRTLPTVVKLKAKVEAVAANAGETVKIPLQLDRTTNFPGEMTVRLQPEALKRGYAAEPLKFKAGQTEAVATLQLPDTFGKGSNSVTFRGTGRLKDGTVIITETKVRLRPRK